MNEKLFFYLNNLAGKSDFFDWLVVFCAEYLAYVLVVIFLAILIFSKKTSREKIKIFIFTVVSIFLSRIIITETVRYFYRVSRPFVNNTVHQLIFHEISGSFPSGHTAFFFALAMAVHLFYKSQTFGKSEGLTFVFFTGAILMGLARVITGVHWPLDILGGAIAGILSSWAVYQFFKSKLQNKVDSV